MKSKVALTIFLGLVVACLLFLNLRAILRPAKYEAVYQERCELNTNRLTSILLLQELYHERYHCYAPHIDTLIDSNLTLKVKRRRVDSSISFW